MTTNKNLLDDVMQVAGFWADESDPLYCGRSSKLRNAIQAYGDARAAIARMVETAELLDALCAESGRLRNSGEPTQT